METELQWIQALRGIAAIMVLFSHGSPLGARPDTGRFHGCDEVGLLRSRHIFHPKRLPGLSFSEKEDPVGWIHTVHEETAAKNLRGLLAGTLAHRHRHRHRHRLRYRADLPSAEKIIFSTLLLYPDILHSWRAPAWSPTIEIYFYLWIAIITLAATKSPVKAIVMVMVSLAGWGLFWLLRYIELVFAGQQPLRTLFTGLGIEFLAGALVAEIYDRKHWLLSHGRLTMATSILMVIVGVRIGMTSPYFDRVGVMRVANFGLAGLGALLLVLSVENTKLRPPTWLVGIGHASYSLYLLHTFLLDVSGRIRFENSIVNAVPHFSHSYSSCRSASSSSACCGIDGLNGAS